MHILHFFRVGSNFHCNSLVFRGILLPPLFLTTFRVYPRGHVYPLKIAFSRRKKQVPEIAKNVSVHLFESTVPPPYWDPTPLFGYPGYCLDTGGGTPQKGSFGVPPGPGGTLKPGFPTRGIGKKGTFGVPHPQKPVFDHFLGKKGGKTPQKGGFLGVFGGFLGVFRGQKSHFRVPRLPGRVPPPTLPRLNPMGNRPGVPKNPIWGTRRYPKSGILDPWDPAGSLNPLPGGTLAKARKVHPLRIRPPPCGSGLHGRVRWRCGARQ